MMTSYQRLVTLQDEPTLASMLGTSSHFNIHPFQYVVNTQFAASQAVADIISILRDFWLSFVNAEGV